MAELVRDKNREFWFAPLAVRILQYEPLRCMDRSRINFGELVSQFIKQFFVK